MHHDHRRCVVALLTAQTPPTKPATAEDAKAFVKKLDTDLRKLYVRQSTAEWIKSTYITDDTERNAAAMNEDLMAYLTQANKDALRFKGLKLDPETERMLYLLRISSALPAPVERRQARRAGHHRREARGHLRQGQVLQGRASPARTASPPRSAAICSSSPTCWRRSPTRRSRPPTTRCSRRGRAGTTPRRRCAPCTSGSSRSRTRARKEIGSDDLGELWRSAYDMPPADFEKETDRLWNQVKPLYDDLHCYVRGKLAKKYGADKVPATGPIPAHLLGNMWAQEWANVYPLVEPYQGQPSLDVTKKLEDQKYDPQKLVRLGENFFTSLGMDPLPKTFWERSQFTKPRDREVVCHAWRGT